MIPWHSIKNPVSTAGCFFPGIPSSVPDAAAEIHSSTAVRNVSEKFIKENHIARDAAGRCTSFVQSAWNAHSYRTAVNAVEKAFWYSVRTNAAKAFSSLKTRNAPHAVKSWPSKVII